MTPRTLFLAVPSLALLLTPSPVRAQLELPRPSPLGKVSQVVGLTEIAVEYSSPAVRGRRVFGDLLPWGKLWRTGANGATKVSFSKDVTVAGKPVPAGTYALFTIPGKSEWTLILNKNPGQAGTNDYKQELDQLRFTARPKAIPSREHLTFLFADFNDAGASLDLEWEKVRVTIPIKVATDAQAQTSINGIDDGIWRQYTAAARYLLERKDYDQGLRLIEKSLAMKEDWQNVWVKAALLAGKGRYREAYPLAQKAKELGDKAPQFFLEADVKKALTEWKAKL